MHQNLPTPLPLVSFGVPAYNHERYIQRCLDAIADEPYEPKELVLIDDGSTDTTRAIIERWIAENRHRLSVNFISRPNRGVSATLNEIVSHCRGKYLRICASDDYVMAGSLTDMVMALESHPAKRVVIGDAIIVDENDACTMDSAIFSFYHGRKKNYFSDAGLLQEIVCNWSLPGCVQLLRRDLYSEIGGYDEQLKIEDWDFMLRVVARNYLMYIDRKVAAYRVHSSNSFKTISKKDPLESARLSLRVLEQRHTLFSGRVRRAVDYRLLKERGIVEHLLRGRRPNRLAKIRIRLYARIRTLFRQVP